MIDVYELMEKHDLEYLKFDRVEYKPSNRRDLCAAILLDKLLPAYHGCMFTMICSADTDEIRFGADIEKLAEVATKDDIIYLLRCGVCIKDEQLCMFL